MYNRYSKIFLRTLVLSIMCTLFVACNHGEQDTKTVEEEDGVNQTEDNLSDEIDQSYFEIADVPLFSFRDSNSGLYGYISLYAEDSSKNIFRLSLVDGSVEGLAEGQLHMIDNLAGYVYFSSNEDSALFRMNLDGSQQTEIYRGDINWNWINIIDDTLYLLDWNPDDHTYLYRYKSGKEDLSLINY